MDHALLAALRFHRPHAPAGTSLGESPQDPPSQSSKAAHGRRAVPGLARGSSLRSGRNRPSRGQPRPATRHDRTEARPDREPVLLERDRRASSNAAGSSPSREPSCLQIPGIKAPGSRSRSAAKHRWHATTSKPVPTHSGAVPKTGWAAMESSSRPSGLLEQSRILDRSSPGMNRSAPCKSSAAALSFARSTSTAAPVRPGRSPSTAASGTAHSRPTTEDEHRSTRRAGTTPGHPPEHRLRRRKRCQEPIHPQLSCLLRLSLSPNRRKTV